MTDATTAAPEGTTATSATSILAGLSSEPAPAAPPVKAPEPTQHEPAKAPASWRDRLPEDLRGNPSLAKFENEEGLAKSYVNLERMLGGDRVPVPKDADDAEAWDRYYAAGGRPAKADEYKVTRPENLEPGMTVDEEGEGFLRSFAHSNGWNQRQFDNAYKAFYEHRVKESVAWRNMQKAQVEEGERALQREGNAQETKTLAKATLQQYFDDATIAKLEHAGVGSDPGLIRVLAKIGKDLTGHQILKGGQTGEPIKTVDQLKADADNYRQQHATALYDKQHPEHSRHVAELTKIYNRMHPDAA